jgi:hypothetical protein
VYLQFIQFAMPLNLAFWVCAIGTPVALVWLAWHYSLAVASTRWPHVQGRVVKSWVERKWSADTPTHSPRVEYVYEVNGLRYSSRNMRIAGNISTWKRRAERIAAAYRVGDPVEVWYDPDKHTRATLKPGGAGWILVELIVVSVLGPVLAFVNTPAGRGFLRSLGLREES